MSDVTVAVYRAPMRSRRDDVDHGAMIERALTLGLCGFGEAADDGRSARRVERFAEVDDGSFVWTRDTDGLYGRGRTVGPYFYDASDVAPPSILSMYVNAVGWQSRCSSRPC